MKQRRFILLVLMMTVVLGCGERTGEPASKEAAGGWVKSPRGAGAISVGTFEQEVRTSYQSGHTMDEFYTVLAGEDGSVYAGGPHGLLYFKESSWEPVVAFVNKQVTALVNNEGVLLAACDGKIYSVEKDQSQPVAELPAGSVEDLAVSGDIYVATRRGLYKVARGQCVPETSLNALLGQDTDIRQVAAGPENMLAVAAAAGLFYRAGGAWHALVPEDATRRWALLDVKGVAFDDQGRLWAAAPHGVVCAESLPDSPKWRLYDAGDGLPYNDFTAAVSDEDGSVWFGTKLGAIRFDGQHWAYRQGLRWLPNDDIRDIAVTDEGDTWFATAQGIGLIERRPMTLAEKSKFYEDEIDLRHRRTPYGFVDWVRLRVPGDKATSEQRDSDNDGGWTAMYGAGECYAYAVTKDPKAKERAKAAFEALRFLRLVTQGGDYPAPAGFVARTVLPTDGPDPNEGEVEHDKNKQMNSDALWRVIEPRWPKSADGKCYWKSDTSSDELDAHYFFYAQYYDLVADSDAEKALVREQVAAITDHLIKHDYHMEDHAGPTRWSRYDPALLNRDFEWWSERGLNSLSMLSYLKVAEHITGDGKYVEAAKTLIEDHGYAMNAMYPKAQSGPGSGNQADDKMALMCYYDLLKYEEDPGLRQMYALSLYRYGLLEAPEMNPFFNFILAAGIEGESVTDAFGTHLLPFDVEWIEDGVNTLKRWPLDLVDWKLTNSHRTDLVQLPAYARDGDSTEGLGCRHNGKVLPVDERYVEHWDHDPWELDEGGEGRRLADGASFLLPYYMGRYHGFIQE